jgi:Major Facilitator Superfamily
LSTMAGRARFFGWRVVWSAFALAVFGWGVGFYGPPVYLHTVIQRTGWPLPLVSSAVTVHFLVGAIVIANLPALYRRFGVPRVTSAGVLTLAGGVVGWAIAATPVQLFAAAILSGGGWVAMGAAAVNAIVAPWFERARPAALATAYNGASIGGLVFTPLWVALIGRVGFVAAATAMGTAMVITIWTLSRTVFSLRPEDVGQAPDGDAPATPSSPVSPRAAPPLPGRTLWHHAKFLTLAAGMALALFAQIGLLAHLFSILVPVLGADRAGVAMGIAAGLGIAGRTLVGWLMPPGANRRVIACASYGVQVAGSVLAALAYGSSTSVLLLGVCLFGVGIGNATSLPPMIAQTEFARGDVQRIVSLAVAIAQATYAFAPGTFGVVRSIDTPVMFGAAAVVQLAAIACLLSRR